MTWVRYDDNVRNHPKVESLDDATYRLWREAIEWCAQNLTDGVIRSHQLAVTSIRASRPRATKLVQKGLWHLAGAGCRSAKCPPSGFDGWVVHDYFEYQPTREKVREEQAAKAERQRRWLESKKGGSKDAPRDASQDGSDDVVGDASLDGAPAPPRPAPKGGAGTTSLPAPPAAVGGVAASGGGAERSSVRRCPTCDNALTSAYHRNVCRGEAA